MGAMCLLVTTLILSSTALAENNPKNGESTV